MMKETMHHHTKIVTRLLTDIRKISLTCMIAVCCGWICLHMGLPAPYLIGSLLGVWVIGYCVVPLRTHLGMARWVRIPVILGLAVLIGAAFNQDIFEKTQQWWISVSIMLITTLFVCVAGYYFLTRIRHYEKKLAFFCSIPGGQAEVLILARQMTDKDYVVALFHLTRVMLIFTATPLLLAFLQGKTAVATSNLRLSQMPSLFDMPPSQIALFVGLALGGYAIAKILHLPLPYLLGPMGLSIISHSFGWADLPRIHEFVIIAQIVIGGAIGARLAQVKLKDTFAYLKDASIHTILIMSTYFVAALCATALSGLDFLTVWLAFVPGGLYEVTLLALLFGFDVVFVAFHHTMRVIPIFFTMSFISKRLF